MGGGFDPAELIEGEGRQSLHESSHRLKRIG
jgi:hypothetical protein